MLFKIRPLLYTSVRTHKNFGHKSQPTPTVTVLWHGFLTATFIAVWIDWKKMVKLILPANEIEEDDVNQSSKGMMNSLLQ